MDTMDNHEGRAMDVTTEQAAELLGVTRRSIARYISSGKLAARRHGLRMFSISLDDLREFAAKNNLLFNESVAQKLTQQ